VGFVTTGLALVLLDAGGRAGVRPAQILALVPAILATEALAMYGYGRAERSFADESLSAAFTPMAFVTAVCLLALSFGILFARPGRGFMLLFLGGDFGALIARRLLPAAVVVPLVLGWLRLAGERAGLYGSATGVALFAVGTMVVFTILIGWSAAAV